MAKAESENLNNISLYSNFGKKPDESCTIAIKIEDIVDKIKTSEQIEFCEDDVVDKLEKMKSPERDEIFESVLEQGDIKFKLFVVPNAKYDGQTGSIMIAAIIDCPENTKWNKIKMLIAERSDGVFLKTPSILPAELRKNIVKHHFGISSVLSHDQVLADKNAAYFPEGAVTIKAIATIRGEKTVVHTSSKLPEKSVTPAQITQKMADDFKNMLENQSFSDFRIICKGEVIPCHRAILSSRSEIFGAMLEHNMKESETGEVEINDFDPKTMKAVVLYIYTGKVDYSPENTEQLLKAADKYRLEELKNSIEDALIEGVKIENAIEMFVLGDAVHADKLRDISKITIVENAVAIVKMDGWKEALGKFQDLTFEILESVVNSKAVA